MTLQITTRVPNDVMDAYIERFQHGISCAEVIGGYSRETMWLLHTVVSTYESKDIIELVCDVDPGAVINIFRTDNFVGGWWHGNVDEPVPTSRPRPRQAGAPAVQARPPQQAKRAAAGRRSLNAALLQLRSNIIMTTRIAGGLLLGCNPKGQGLKSLA